MGINWKNAGMSLLDPGNIFGGREGGIQWDGFFDPGGEIQNELGITDPRKMANLFGAFDWQEISDEINNPEVDVPESPDLPTRSDPKVTDAMIAARLRASSSGRAGTILTGNSGLTEQATVQKKTLLGQ